MRWAFISAESSASAEGANITLVVTGNGCARTEFKGRLDEYVLFDLAKRSLEGLNAIHSAQVAQAENTARLIGRLRGGDL
jgi:hypothetical protein